MSTNSTNIENSLFGTMLLGQNVFQGSSGVVQNGVYYSAIFQKPSNQSWYQVLWQSNENITTTNINLNTFGKFNVEMRVRVGNNLPYNYSENQPYTLNQINSLIPTNTPEQIDAILYRWTLGRSILSVSDTIIIPTPNTFVFEAGSAMNFTELNGSNDGAWSYWSLPINYSPSYIPGNTSFDFLQLRITLENLNPIIDPVTGFDHFAEVYSTTVTSILAQS